MEFLFGHLILVENKFAIKKGNKKEEQGVQVKEQFVTNLFYLFSLRFLCTKTIFLCKNDRENERKNILNQIVDKILLFYYTQKRNKIYDPYKFFFLLFRNWI